MYLPGNLVETAHEWDHTSQHRRFRGPEDSANGGYVAGLLARDLGSSDCKVTLRSPPKLEHDLEYLVDSPRALLLDGDRTVATAVRFGVEVNAPEAPPFEAAEAATGRYEGLQDHFCPSCFVCGPHRTEGDGLRIFAGPLRCRDQTVAAVWTPAHNLAEPDGTIAPEFIWAALDCPGYFALRGLAGQALLTQLAVRIISSPEVGEAHIVLGWHLKSSGRKHSVGTALYTRQGEIVAVAQGAWVSL